MRFSFALELFVVGDILVLSVVEVLWILNVASKRLEERNEDSGVTVAVVASTYARHHIRYFDLIVLTDYDTLLNRTSTEKRN